MFSSLNITAETVDEVPAKSSLPWVWLGFLFAGAFFIGETVLILLPADRTTLHLVLILISVGGWIYWLFCVSRFNNILREVSRNHYPITGAEAAGKHLIPFYNLVWMFRWSNTLTDYVNDRGRVQMISGNVLGTLFLVFLLLGRFFDSGLALIGMFAVAMYISIKLRRHLELIAAHRDILPPLPDANLFGYVPVQRQENPSPSGEV